jgi:DNA-binding PadR family transcriptional regulator
MDRELLLLGILREQEMHGYELHEFIDKNLASCTDMKKSTAYYLLKKMEEAGLISQETRQEGNRPPRQDYHLTPAGETEFQRLLRANLAHYSTAYFTGDIGLVFLDQLEPEEALSLLNSRRAELAEELAAAERIPSRPGHPSGLQLVFDHLVYHLRAELAWTDSLVNRLNDSGVRTPSASVRGV